MKTIVHLPKCLKPLLLLLGTFIGEATLSSEKS
jgi:hypothetical protein